MNLTDTQDEWGGERPGAIVWLKGHEKSLREEGPRKSRNWDLEGWMDSGGCEMRAGLTCRSWRGGRVGGGKKGAH